MSPRRAAYATQRKPKGSRDAAILLTSKATTWFGTWNVKTLYEAEAGKSAQIVAEMIVYNLSILDLCKTRWMGSGCIQLSTRQSVLYSGREYRGSWVHADSASCQVTHSPKPLIVRRECIIQGSTPRSYSGQ
ncbi:hypothetical protein ACROYT_G040939 [Oculina patagonica]